MADGSNEITRYLANREKLIAGHAYDPTSERDACGVGLVCAIDGKPRREVVELAIRSLKAIWHRGAVDADRRAHDHQARGMRALADLRTRWARRSA